MKTILLFLGFALCASAADISTNIHDLLNARKRAEQERRENVANGFPARAKQDVSAVATNPPPAWAVELAERMKGPHAAGYSNLPHQFHYLLGTNLMLATNGGNIILTNKAVRLSVRNITPDTNSLYLRDYRPTNLFIESSHEPLVVRSNGQWRIFFKEP